MWSNYSVPPVPVRKTLLRRRRRLGKSSFKTPHQGLESSFRCRNAGQRLPWQFFYRHRHDTLQRRMRCRALHHMPHCILHRVPRHTMRGNAVWFDTYYMIFHSTMRSSTVWFPPLHSVEPALLRDGGRVLGWSSIRPIPGRMEAMLAATMLADLRARAASELYTCLLHVNHTDNTLH